MCPARIRHPPNPPQNPGVLLRRTWRVTEVARAPSLCSRVVDRIPSQNFTPTALQPRYHLHCLKQRGPGGGLWQLPDFCLHLGNEDPALPTPLGNMQTLWAAHLEWWTQTLLAGTLPACFHYRCTVAQHSPRPASGLNQPVTHSTW